MKLAAIQIRGSVGARQEVKDTLKMLNLHKKHTCVILEDNPINKGMLRKLKDFITFGNLNEETEKLLKEKRGQKNSEGKLRKDFHLHPPIGGFERKGIKKTFIQGGVLGDRKEEINVLIKKML